MHRHAGLGGVYPSRPEHTRDRGGRVAYPSTVSLYTLHDTGDLIDPVAQGVLDWLEVQELHEIVGGALPGRESDDEIVLFKSNGIAAWDLAIGAAAVAAARERGIGREL